MSWCLNLRNISMILCAHFLFFHIFTPSAKDDWYLPILSEAHFHPSFSSSERVTEDETTIGWRCRKMFHRIKHMCTTAKPFPLFFISLSHSFQHIFIVQFGWNFLNIFILGWHIWHLHYFLRFSFFPRILPLPPENFLQFWMPSHY